MGCKTKYVLYCDSDDAVLRDDPAKTIKYLQEEDCELLMSNTHSTFAYECMPVVRKFADKIARENGVSQCYINAGVFVGRVECMKEVINEALKYVTGQDLLREEYWRLLDNGQLCEQLPEFPKGIGSDQVILRYLQPRFFPRMKVDYKGRLALR